MMKITVILAFCNLYILQIKANNKFYEKNSGLVDSGFVKTCDELIIG